MFSLSISIDGRKSHGAFTVAAACAVNKNGRRDDTTFALVVSIFSLDNLRLLPIIGWSPPPPLWAHYDDGGGGGFSVLHWFCCTLILLLFSTFFFSTLEVEDEMMVMVVCYSMHSASVRARLCEWDEPTRLRMYSGIFRPQFPLSPSSLSLDWLVFASVSHTQFSLFFPSPLDTVAPALSICHRLNWRRECVSSTLRGVLSAGNCGADLEGRGWQQCSGSVVHKSRHWWL